jgi:hypothetical protein
VSVCIASVAQRGSVIVFATDQMASLESVSADYVMTKADFLTPFWIALWAGDDTTSIPPMLRRARATLHDSDQARNATVEQVSVAVVNAYRAETQERAVSEILSVYGLDMPTFLANGLSMFGDAGFSVMQQRLEQFDLGSVELLVCGYTPLGPTIFTVGLGGTVRYYDRLGFWAIGAGNHLAASSLAFRGQNSIRPIEETIYHVCEAKFRAEAATGVGKTTTLGLLRRNGPALIPKEQIDAIKALWEKHGKPPIPTEALEIIRGSLNPLKASQVPEGSTRAEKDPPPSQE